MPTKLSDSKFDLADVTKAQVGLALADNTRDVDKEVSTAQAAAIALKTTPVEVDAQIASGIASVSADAISLKTVTGTTTQIRYDKILGALGIIEMVKNASNNLEVVRYIGDGNTIAPYYRDTFTYNVDLKLIEVKHWHNTADLNAGSESGITTMTYVNSSLATVNYTE